MLTIPASMQTALKKNPNQEFRYIIKMGRSLIANPYTASNFYFSSSSKFGTNQIGITDTSVYPVVPILLKEPSITENLNLREHKSTVGGFSIQLDDNFLFQNPANSNALEKFSDQLNKYNIYNKDLYIYLWLGGLTNLQTECLEVYKGIMDDIKISNGKVTIPISNSTFTVQKELPQKLINKTDYPDAPIESLGKGIQIVYGDHSFEGIKTTTPADATLNYINNMVEGIKVSNYKYLIANSTIFELGTDDVWLLDSQTGRFLNLDSSHVTVNNPDGDGYCSITLSIGQELTLYDWWFPSSAANLGTNDHNWSNPNNSGDNDISTFATLNATFTTAASADTAYIRITFPDYDMDGFDYISDIEMFYRGDYTLMNGDDSDLTYKLACSGIDVSAELNLKAITNSTSIHDVGSSALQSTKHGIELQSGDGGDTYKLNYKGSETANISEIANAAAIETAVEGLSEFNSVNILGSADAYWIEYEGTSIGKNIDIPEAIDKTDSLNATISMTREGKQATKDMVSAYLEVRARQPVSALTPAVYIKCHEVYKKIKLVFDAGYKFDSNRFKLFAACKGRETSATVAGHFSGLSTGDLLEIPAHIIDSIIYDELGQTIDTTPTPHPFQKVATEQASWKIAPVIDKQQNSKDILDKIAKQAMSFVYWNASNKAAMDTFFAANTTDYIFKLNDIKSRPLLYKSPLKDIVNDFVLKYKKDGNSGNLQSTIEREDDRASVGSQAVYNAVMDKVMDADYISDETTAGLLANHWAKNDDDSFWSVLHNIIEFETVDLRGVNFWNAGDFKPILALELTDIIELHSGWDAKMELFGATWASKQFKIFSITRLPGTLKIKAFSL